MGELDQRLRENEESILNDNLEDQRPNGEDSDEEGVESSLDLFTAGMLNAVGEIDQEEHNVLTFDRDFLDAPEDWVPPGPPDNWNPEPKTNFGEPPFSEVDNPGKWDNYIFQATFKKTDKNNKYAFHSLPTRCTSVQNKQ